MIQITPVSYGLSMASNFLSIARIVLGMFRNF